ncbi:MAG TPA: UPF0182 family protein [Actinomycetota bacterium]|nr:UPF0182 family protein [Actinomycetota bacterium]
MVIRMPASNNSRRVRVSFLVVFFLLIISISTVVGLYTDLLWFKEVGFQQVFWKVLSSRAILVGAFGLVFFVLCLVNLLVVGRAAPAYRLPASGDQEDPFERFREAFIPFSKWIPIGVSAFLALLFALRLAPAWDRFVLAMNEVPFNATDPIFGKDIGFFMFRLPMYQLIYSWLFSALVVVTLLVTSAYYLTGAIRPQAAIDRVSPQVKVHLSVLIGLAALLRAWGYRLNQFELVYSERGTVGGASFTDVNAELPALKLLVAISIISAILFLVNIRFRGWTLPLIGVGLWLLTSILAAGLFPFVVQRFRVEPAELQRERVFIERNIRATRTAFGLDSMRVQEFPIEAGISAQSVAENQTTLNNVRLWDPETLMRAFRQLQEIRTYYKFQDVDVDRYNLGPERRQLMLALRELDVTSLQNRSWLNDHLVYTHGFGAVASPTNESTGEGAPELLLRDIPPVGQSEELELTQPGIYFGEGPATYSVINTEQRELDYTAPEGNETTVYDGEAGVRLEHLFRRLAFAWRFRDVNLAISGLIDGDSRVIFNRDIRERVRKAAPFLELDGDPYAVVSEGKIMWILDAYTVSNMYPYAQSVPLNEHTRIRGGVNEGDPSILGTENYVRNSVKVTMDAYDGTMRLYVWDEEDPLIQAWGKAFPDLFVDKEEMPADLLAHVRYPEDLFRIQASVYQRYHMTDSTDFYQREDEWVIPANPMRGTGAAGGATQELEPYYVLMRLPDTDREEYVMILPMNPRNRPNMVSLLAAKSDQEEYGQLADFRFPSGVQTDGVGQIHSRINANEEISRTITLLEQSGSDVILGNLLVIPVGKSIMYSQPLFLQASNNAIPELKYVILATGDDVKMAPTLDEALAALLEGRPTVTPAPDTPPAEPAAPAPPPAPGPPAPAPAPPSGDRDELLQQATDALNAAETAARNGDWARYGTELQRAKDALQRAQNP